jgi:hypothetical protein
MMFVCDCPECGRHFEVSIKATSASMPTIACVCGYVFMTSAAPGRKTLASRNWCENANI